MEQIKESNKYNPLIKRILKSFQATADFSLNGPSSMYSQLNKCTRPGSPALRQGSRETDVSSWPLIDSSSNGKASKVSGESARDLREMFGQMPVLLPKDDSVGVLTETLVNGQTIACFEIGGEKRLCLPQVLNRVLNAFTLPQINSAFEELRIFSSTCTSGQLETLKHHRILPASAASCGLVTQSNAERLCSRLLHQFVTDSSSETSFRDGFRVSHECFGKCQGVFVPELYVESSSRAISCYDCSRMFSPAEFVCHSHRRLENRVCHWGFDSSNWRRYLVLSKDQEVTDAVKERFECVKALFDGVSSNQNQLVETSQESVTKDRVRRRIQGEVDCRVAGDKKRSLRLHLTPTSSDSAVDRCNFSFAPNISLARNEDKRCHESSNERPAKRLKTNENPEDQSSEVTFDISSLSAFLKSSCISDGLDTEEPSDTSSFCKSMEREIFQLLELELALFQIVVNGKALFSTEMKETIYSDYLLLKRRHLLLVDRLFDSQSELRKVDDTCKTSPIPLRHKRHSFEQSKCQPISTDLRSLLTQSSQSS